MRAFLLVLLLCGPAQASDLAMRVKDLARLQSARDNQLVGYGLVVGLPGTGDGLRNAPFTDQSLTSILTRMGIAPNEASTRARNVAAVLVTADIPAFAREGGRIDVTVSSIGDATSLRGGTLVLTALRAGDERVYAAAQGPIVVSGFRAAGAAETVEAGVPTVGRVPRGAIVERAVPGGLAADTMLLLLDDPDFSTAVAMADAINAHLSGGVARPLDARTVELHRPKGLAPARFVAGVERIRVAVDAPARVVVNERSGTIVIGAQVRVSPVTVSHGALTVRVTEQPRIVQPNPFANGETAVEAASEIDVATPGGPFATVGGTDLDSIVEGLNALGVRPDDTIAILQAIKGAGALRAELVVQ